MLKNCLVNYFFAIITSLDLIMAITSSPAFKPRSSTASLVMVAVIAPGVSIFTLIVAVTTPSLTSSTFPFNEFLALILIISPP